MRKTLFVFTFLACTPQTNAMLIEALPQDLNNKILNTIPMDISTKSLLEVAKTINSFAKINRSFNIFINDPDRTLIWIKHLAQKFNCSDEEVADTLYTEAANDIYNKQHLLVHGWLVYSKTKRHLARLNSLKTQGLDLNFTYTTTTNRTTALMIASTSRIGNEPTAIWLIENGADINILAKNGTNAFMFALYNGIWPDLIQCFLDHPKLQINHQNNDGDTPLLYSLFDIHNNTRHPAHSPMPDSIYSCLYTIVQQVLDKGADPELANNKGQTPLGLATNIGYQPLIDLIKDTIVKKHTA